MAADIAKVRCDSLDEAKRLLAGLWQEAPFPSLPADAPPELEDYVQEIKNPRRVYVIHSASRRHDFQLLVQRYVFQLRMGCGIADCTLPTCFTCRKRLAGTSPIRRYNPTSARTLAVYLASRDNPESGLCPSLRTTLDAVVPLDNLKFSATLRSPSRHLSGRIPSTPPCTRARKGQDGPTTSRSPSSPRRPSTSPNRKPTPPPKQNACLNSRPSAHRDRELEGPKVKITERPISRDYRSFAATAFGTVAFKMVEWLTPQGVDGLVGRISELGVGADSSHEREQDPGTTT